MTNQRPTSAIALSLALAAGTLMFAPQAASAQLSFEGRGSLQYPTGDFGDGANSQAGLGVDVFFHVKPAMSIYAGYSWDQFGCDECGDNDGISTDGFEAGAKFLFSRTGSILPWGRIGAILHRIEYDTGAFTAQSDRELGLQASIGLDIPLGEMLSFSPALRYQTFSTDFEGFGGAVTASDNVSFIALDIGLHVHPGR